MSASLNLSLRQAQQWLSQAQTVGDAAAVVQRVHTDSRSLQAGDLFVALKGERFDAHDFLSQAKAQGVACALAERGLQEAGLSGLQVPDSRMALGGQTNSQSWQETHFSRPLGSFTSVGTPR